MMYVFGIGEIAVSVSGVPAVADATITHTDPGGRRGEHGHCAMRRSGTVIGMRGPFGTGWGLAEDVTGAIWSSSRVVSAWRRFGPSCSPCSPTGPHTAG